MLFRACTSRLGRPRTGLFAGQGASQLWKSEVTVSNDRAPDVLKLAMNLLNPAWFPQGHSQTMELSPSERSPVPGHNTAGATVATERIFAALDLIGRLNLSFHDEGCVERVALEKLTSPVWQVRELAARILISRVSPWDAFDMLGRLVSGMFNQKDQNMIHGRLLCIREILRIVWHSRAEPLPEHVRLAAAILEPIVTQIMADDMSSIIRTTFLAIVDDVLEVEI